VWRAGSIQQATSIQLSESPSPPMGALARDPELFRDMSDGPVIPNNNGDEQ
jgi:hypothetical protein